MSRILKALLLLQSLVLIGVVAWFLSGMSFTLLDKQQLDSSLSQFIHLAEKDEYVIAELQTAETLETKEYKTLFERYPIGDSTASISLQAYYRYFVRLSDVNTRLEDRVLIISVPALHLQTPVAFDTLTKKEQGENTLFGTDHEHLLEALNQQITTRLGELGKGHLATAHDKAAAALAANFHAFLAKQGNADFYDEIIVVIENDKRVSRRKFDFSGEVCPYGDCLKLPLGKGRQLLIH